MKAKDSVGLVISIQVTLLWVNIHLSKAVLSLAGYLYSITCTGQLEVTGCKFHWELYSKKACTLLIDCTVSVYVVLQVVIYVFHNKDYGKI